MVIECKKCGRTTNTALSEWVDNEYDGYAHGCYAAYEHGRWVIGCLPPELQIDPLKRQLAKRVIND